MYRVRTEEVRRRAGIERELPIRVHQRVLRWFGQVGEWMITVWRRVLMAEACRVRVWSKLRLGRMDGAKVALGSMQEG